MYAVLVSLRPTWKHAACKRNNASMAKFVRELRHLTEGGQFPCETPPPHPKKERKSTAEGLEMSQYTPDFQGQLLHCIVQPLLSHWHRRGA